MAKPALGDSWDPSALNFVPRTSVTTVIWWTTLSITAHTSDDAEAQARSTASGMASNPANGPAPMEENTTTISSSSKSSSHSTYSASRSTSSFRSKSSNDVEEISDSEGSEESTSTSRSSTSISKSNTPSDKDEGTSTSSSTSSATSSDRTTQDSLSSFSALTSPPPSPTSVPTLSAPSTISLDSTASASSSGPPTPAPATESSNNLSAILGISLGSLAGLLLLGFFLSWLIRYRKEKRRHAALSPDDYIPGSWPDNHPYDPNRNTSLENTNANTYTRPSTLSRTLSSIGAGRFYASATSAANIPLSRTPTTPAAAEVDPMTQIHEASTRPASAPARGEAMEMRSNPAMPNNANTIQRGVSVQGEQKTGHHYRGVEMTGFQAPDSLRPGHRRQTPPPWMTATELYAQQHGGRQWRAPAW